MMNWKYHEHNKARYRFEAVLLMHKSFWIEECIRTGDTWLKLAPNCWVQVRAEDRYRLPQRSEHLARCAGQRYELLAIIESEGLQS